MSASSWLVTAGIMMALRSKLAPLIFLMRPISLRSIGPNLAKSTLGQGMRPKAAPSPPDPPLADCALVCVAPDMTDLVKACTSSCVMRPLFPLPFSSSKGTPSSRANLRTEGDAWGKPTVVPPGACAGASMVEPDAEADSPAPTEVEVERGVDAAAVAIFAFAFAETGDEATDAAEAVGAACAEAAGAAAGALTASTPSRIANKSPILILSPNLTLSSFNTPACDDGISIEALSDSTVTKDCSTFMLSPDLTKTSITATSLKSPISGTFTSINAISVSLCMCKNAPVFSTQGSLAKLKI